MELVTAAEHIAALQKNTILGSPSLVKSRIEFQGEGNILFCEEGTVLKDSVLHFRCSQSVVYLCKPRKHCIMRAEIGEASCVFIGDKLHATKAFELYISEGRTIFIGRDCLFAKGVSLRASDAHLIYSAQTHRRLNATKSIFVGDHVWLGTDAFVLKGTQIGSGSILGAGAVVSGKTIPSNTSWAGNPARQVSREPVFYSGVCMYDFDKADRDAHERFDSDKYLYHKDGHTLSFEEVDGQLFSLPTSKEKLAYLRGFAEQPRHNRFYIPDASDGERGFWSKLLRR